MMGAPDRSIVGEIFVDLHDGRDRNVPALIYTAEGATLSGCPEQIFDQSRIRLKDSFMHKNASLQLDKIFVEERYQLTKGQRLSPQS